MGIRVSVLLSACGLGLVLANPAGAQSPYAPPSRGPWVPSWEVVYGGYRQVDDLAQVGPAEAWGVDIAELGTGGEKRPQTAFVHWKDGVWRAAQIADGVRLTAVAMAGTDFGFAVGAEGVIFRFDGWRWRAVGSPVRLDLFDVALLGPGEGWAVGERGLTLRWDGQRWRVTESPVQFARLTAVTILAPGDAWAVSRSGDVLHYDGEWAVVQTPPINELADVAFDSPGHGMVVGRGVLELRDGQWRQLEVEARWTVSAAFHDGTAYVVADGCLLSYTGGAWLPVDFSAVPVELRGCGYQRVVPGRNGVWGLAADGTTVWITAGGAHFVRPAVSTFLALDMATPDLGWAGGDARTAAFVGAAGGRWSLEQPTALGTIVWDIDLVSETDGWAVGQLPGNPPLPRMWRWDGSRWSEWPVEKTWVPKGIDMLAPDDGWVSGSNVVARWDGDAWRHVPDAPLEVATGVLSMLRGGDSPEGWFGSFGVIYHLHDGDWEPEVLPERVLLHTIDVPAPNEGWAASAGALFRYDGEAWHTVRVPLSPIAEIKDLHAPEPGSAWVLVDPDGLLHWNGVNWELHTLGRMGGHARPVRLHALRPDPRAPGTDVWLAGAPPAIARYRVVAPLVRLYLPVARRGG